MIITIILFSIFVIALVSEPQIPNLIIQKTRTKDRITPEKIANTSNFINADTVLQHSIESIPRVDIKKNIKDKIHLFISYYLDILYKFDGEIYKSMICIRQDILEKVKELDLDYNASEYLPDIYRVLSESTLQYLNIIKNKYLLHTHFFYDF